MKKGGGGNQLKAENKVGIKEKFNDAVSNLKLQIRRNGLYNANKSWEVKLQVKGSNKRDQIGTMGVIRWTLYENMDSVFHCQTTVWTETVNVRVDVT